MFSLCQEGLLVYANILKFVRFRSDIQSLRSSVSRHGTVTQPIWERDGFGWLCPDNGMAWNKQDEGQINGLSTLCTRQ